MGTPMNKEQYADFWKPESENFNSNKIYERLSKLIPDGNVLEIGCGIGLGTYNLSKNNNVLSLDNNQFLIDKAKTCINNQNNNCQIHNCELFELTQNDKDIIHQFKPNIIVGWFLGAGGEVVNKYTQEEQNINAKGKLYREKLEDIIISDDLLIDSVEIINLAIRSTRPLSMSKQEVSIEQRKEYDKYVFKNIGFKVTDVKIINWDTSNSDFTYSSVVNSSTRKENHLPTIYSIIAKRIK